MVCYPAEPRRTRGIVQLSTFLIQNSADDLVDRSRFIGERNVLAARAVWVPALPALPALLIVLVTERAVRAPVPAIRALRRCPIMLAHGMLAVFAEGHTVQRPQIRPSLMVKN